MAMIIVPINSLIARDVLEVLVDRAIGDRSNELVIEKVHRYSMARRITILRTVDDDNPPKTPTDRTIQKALTTLVRHDLITRYGKGKYRLNPDCFYYGTSEAQERAAEAYSEDQAA